MEGRGGACLRATGSTEGVPITGASQEPCELIRVEEELKALGVSVAYRQLRKVSSVGGDPLKDLLEQRLASLRSRLTLYSLKDNPVVRAYRSFFWRLKIDPTKVRPSSEALARRALRGEFPRVSPLVDAGNLASVETLVPIGIYDLDLLAPPLTITLTRGEVRFWPIGGGEQTLPAGTPVMVDTRGVVVHFYAHRDSSLTSVRETTRRALVVAVGVKEVPLELVRSAAELTTTYASLVGWAPEGPLCQA